MNDALALLQNETLGVGELLKYGPAGAFLAGLVTLWFRLSNREDHWHKQYQEQEARHMKQLEAKDARIRELTDARIAGEKETVRVLESLDNTVQTLAQEWKTRPQRR